MQLSGTRGVRLEIASVGKVFGEDTDTPFEALRPLTIDIQPGEFVFVAGPISPLWQAENGNLAHGTGPCAGAGPTAAEKTAERAVGRVLAR